MPHDPRKTWQIDGCTIVPEVGESRYFGHPRFTPDSGLPQYYTRWWRINFPNKTHVLSATKETCMSYIASDQGRRQGGLTHSLFGEEAA